MLGIDNWYCGVLVRVVERIHYAFMHLSLGLFPFLLSWSGCTVVEDVRATSTTERMLQNLLLSQYETEGFSFRVRW